MGLLDFLDTAKQAMSGVLPLRYVRVEVAARVLSLSDEFLIKAVERLGQVHAPSAQVKLTAEPQGFGLTATVGADAVQALLELRGLAYAAGNLEVTLATPRGVQFERRPVVNVLVALIIKLAGGTRLAAKIFSTVLPPTLRWDGQTATITAKPEGLPKAVEGLRIEASASRAEGWTRFVLSTAEGLAALQSVLMR